jgi:hypothetical protein
MWQYAEYDVTGLGDRISYWTPFATSGSTQYDGVLLDTIIDNSRTQMQVRVTSWSKPAGSSRVRIDGQLYTTRDAEFFFKFESGSPGDFSYEYSYSGIERFIPELGIIESMDFDLESDLTTSKFTQQLLAIDRK